MKKTICKIASIIMLIAIFYPLKSQAALQGNKNGTSFTVGAAGNASHLFTGIRAMEVGTIGKESQDAQDGIDCHMVKNTEWGTTAMLSASAYGQAPTGNNATATTTGNESGVWQMVNNSGSGGCFATGTELVAGIWTGQTENQYIKTIANADPKYYDLYESETSKPGDATTETIGWKGSSGATFIDSNYPIFHRGYSIGLFAYSHHKGYYSDDMYHSGIEDFRCAATTRAVAVCGKNL